MSKTYYLTTPLYYVNGVPHVGHTYTTVIADAIARYKRLSGKNVCLLTGTDEHGLNVERAARKMGIPPEEAVELFAAVFERVWRNMGISFDEFIRTTESRHHSAVTELFRRVEKNRFIYLGEYSGFYCVHCEAYVPENQKVCPDCNRPAEFMTEESYFFRLSAFQEKLLGFYSDNPDFVIPSTRMNEIVSFVKGGLRDLSISRTSFSWGIPLPDDEKHIFYVWFDALTGYLSGIGFGADDERFNRTWPADVQLIGKDILRFHAVYWPAFLMAAGLEPPRRVLAHGWWTIEGEKMSKSRGNFITAEELSENLDADYIKYFLLREIPLGADGDFSYQAVVNRVNSDLANDLGNLSNRTLKMIESYFDGKIPQPDNVEGGDEELRRYSRETVQLFQENFDKLQINRALDNVWELISVVNRYLVANEPWTLAKYPARKGRLGTVLYQSAEALRIIAVLLGPIIPHGAASILAQLGVKEPLESHRLAQLNWGYLEAGNPIGEVQAVYPRIDPEQFFARLRAGKSQSGKASPDPAAPSKAEGSDSGETEADLISIEDFQKVEMRVGKIVEAERIPKSDRLVKLKVDVGTEIRQVVAGIGKAYEPESLPGRLVTVVINLKPVTLMGVESQGMVVAASDGGKPVLVNFTEPVRLGTRLS